MKNHVRPANVYDSDSHVDSSRIISFDVSGKNSGTQKLYESLGIEVMKLKYYSKNFPELSNAIKMEKKIN